MPFNVNSLITSIYSNIIDVGTKPFINIGSNSISMQNSGVEN